MSEPNELTQMQKAEVALRKRYVEYGKMSGCTSYVQRTLVIGYNTAARLMEQMEEAGVISPPDGTGARRFLRPAQPDARDIKEH